MVRFRRCRRFRVWIVVRSREQRITIQFTYDLISFTRNRGCLFGRIVLPCLVFRLIGVACCIDNQLVYLRSAANLYNELNFFALSYREVTNVPSYHIGIEVKHTIIGCAYKLAVSRNRVFQHDIRSSDFAVVGKCNRIGQFFTSRYFIAGLLPFDCFYTNKARFFYDVVGAVRLNQSFSVRIYAVTFLVLDGRSIWHGFCDIFVVEFVLFFQVKQRCLVLEHLRGFILCGSRVIRCYGSVDTELDGNYFVRSELIERPNQRVGSITLKGFQLRGRTVTEMNARALLDVSRTIRQRVSYDNFTGRTIRIRGTVLKAQCVLQRLMDVRDNGFILTACLFNANIVVCIHQSDSLYKVSEVIL